MGESRLRARAASERAALAEARSAAPPLGAGQRWFVLSHAWLRRWEAFASDAELADDDAVAEPPPPIDNAPLLAPGGAALRPDLMEDVDFVLLPPAAWGLLVHWYGLWHARACATLPRPSRSRFAPARARSPLQPPLAQMAAATAIRAGTPAGPSWCASLQESHVSCLYA